jgi:hypothetical protein
MKSRLIFLCAALFGGFACSGSPQDFVEVPLVARGTSAAEFEVEEGVRLAVTRADVAFGPLYLCAGTQAGEYCDTARLEWRESAVVDALAEEPVEIGTLLGVTGKVRSWMFDYGITSLLTKSGTKVMPAAQELGGFSLVIEGLATIEGTEVPFTLEVAVQQTSENERAVPVVRSSTTDGLDGEVTENTSHLLVTFDPSKWLNALRRADFAALLPECDLGADEVCDAVTFEKSSRPSGAVAQAMTSGVRPRLDLK